jgi:hypothetical protein
MRVGIAELQTKAAAFNNPQKRSDSPMNAAAIYGIALGSLLMVTASNGATISFSASVSPSSYTFFEGTQQESHLTMVGLSSTLELAENIPQSAFTINVGLPVIGVNDGEFPGPGGTIPLVTTFSVAGRSVNLEHSMSFRQIANDQFQLDVYASTPQTLSLPGGDLELRMEPGAAQFRQSDSGAAGLFASRFVWHPVPEPYLATPIAALLALIVLRRRHG